MGNRRALGSAAAAGMTRVPATMLDPIGAGPTGLPSMEV